MAFVDLNYLPQNILLFMVSLMHQIINNCDGSLNGG